MSPMTLGLMIGGVLMAVAAACIFAWASLDGQFDDLEEAKYQMLREEEKR